ncbi:hypothetical protein CY35_08G093300 [Sphagnum magellanicum]|nr:hypothetical protein CY35_08G093300 [Sphagnum magellanicum]
MPVLQQQKMQIGNGNVGKALESIRTLAKILDHFDILTLSQESQNPAKDLLDDEHVADLICYRLAESTSGRGNDEMCQWLFDTYQTEDMELQAVVLRFIPTLCGLYLPHAVSCPDEPLAGFEAVLLALYATELRARNGAPLLINIPSLSQPSPYHTPHKTSRSSAQLQVGEVSSALEPQVAIKSTKRASIVGVALELFWRRIVVMPLKAKLDLCHYAKVWAVQGCSWVNDVDAISKLAILPSQSISTSQPEGDHVAPKQGITLAVGKPLAVDEQSVQHSPAASSRTRGKSLEKQFSAGVVVSTPDSPTAANYHEVGEFHYPDDQLDAPRVTLDQDILRPIFKVLGHCLMGPTSSPELRAAAVDAARALYVRASHALNPEAILASRSLLRLHAAALISSR